MYISKNLYSDYSLSSHVSFNIKKENCYLEKINSS